jgi:S1-C subfamily serine protease
MRRTLPLLLAALLLVAGAACSGDDGDPLGATEGPTGGSCPKGTLDAKDVLACVGPAIAYVSTPSATGSGVLLEGGYVVTNAHVVDPFPTVDLTFPDASRRERVPVVGIDAFADIALLGPVQDLGDIDATPMDLGTGKGTDKGADVFLLGYPGEDEDEPDPTISRGVLSRTRSVAEYGQTYLQTDASIAGGQSGGALVDDHGQLLGISGLSFAEDQFALALDSSDVEQAVNAIEAGRSDEYHGIPDQAGATTSHTLDLTNPLDRQMLVIGPADHDRTVTLDVGQGRTDVGILVYDLYGDALLVNQAGAEVLKDAYALEPSDLGATVSQPAADGSYTFQLPADIEGAVHVSTANPQGARVVVDLSEPSVVAPRTEAQPIELGRTVSGTLGYFELDDVYTLDLHAGDKLHVTATSPQGDPAVLILPPGGSFGDLHLVDDGGGGLYELDADGDYTAPTDGTYRFGVLTYDGVVTGYRFTLERA